MPLSQKTYDERKAKGLCVQCAKPTGGLFNQTGNGKIRCDSCIKSNTLARRNRRAERKKRGLCTECPNKAMPNCALCKTCSIERSKTSTDRYYKNKEAGLCRFCGAETENGESRCPKHKEQQDNWREKQRLQKILED